MNLPLKIVLCVTICLGLGFLSGYYSGSGDTTWYRSLEKPFFQPPPWLFGPVWTILYTMMGISVALVWDQISNSSNIKTSALTLFILQLIFNLVWSPVFFRIQALVAALVVILTLVFLIILTIRAFGKLNTIAKNLLLPYLAWVCFATLLNASIVYLN